MTLKTVNMDLAVAAGTAVTQANLGLDQAPVVQTTSTLTFDSIARTGSLSVKAHSAGPGSSSQFRLAAAADNAAMMESFEFMVSALPSTGLITVGTLRSTSGGACLVQVASTGNARFTQSGGGGVGVTEIPGIVPGIWYCVDLLGAGQSTTAGDLRCRLSIAGDNTPLGTVENRTTANVTAAALHGGDFGVIGGAPEALDVWIDNVRFNDGSTVFPIPNLDTGTLKPLPKAPTFVGTAPTVVGGSANAGQAVADSSDLTYAEGASASATPQSQTYFMPASNVRSNGTIPLRLSQDVAGSLVLKVVIKNGNGTTVATRTGITLTTSFVEYTVTLTSGELAAITDWSANLQIMLEYTS